MKTVDISYRQGGFLYIPLAVMTAQEALHAVKQGLESDEECTFEAEFNGKIVPWDTLEADVTEHDVAGDKAQVEIVFDVNVTLEIEEDADPETAAYEGLSFTLNGLENYFDVKHSEMIEI